jgi:hypothetical protein
VLEARTTTEVRCASENRSSAGSSSFKYASSAFSADPSGRRDGRYGLSRPYRRTIVHSASHRRYLGIWQ